MRSQHIISDLKLATVAAITSCLLCCGCVKRQPEEFSRIESLKPVPSLGINNIRMDALQQTAREMGAQSGLAWRSKQISALLKEQERNLNNIFNFNYLILNSNVLPPVLAEGQTTLNLDNDIAIRAADRVYQIVSYPRFITAPPTWKEYLLMAYKKPDAPNATLLPKNSKESGVWNHYVKIGWNEGVRQADIIFDTNLNRLRRDYAGMVLYRKLLAQNMVSAPFVSKSDLGVTGDGNSLRINDRILRITATSNLKTNSSVWKPIVAKGQRKDDDDDAGSSILSKYRTINGDKIGGGYEK
jgi:defect-in-organelle-trafficking protein DotC